MWVARWSLRPYAARFAISRGRCCPRISRSWFPAWPPGDWITSPPVRSSRNRRPTPLYPRGDAQMRSEQKRRQPLPPTQMTEAPGVVREVAAGDVVVINGGHGNVQVPADSERSLL